MRKKSRKDYGAYINSYAWQAKRRQRIFMDGAMCVRCKARHDLEVHHLTYRRFGSERLSDLITLCHRCHAAVHAHENANRRAQTAH